MSKEVSGRTDRVLLLLRAISLTVNVAVVWWFVKGPTSVSARGGPDVALGSLLKPIVGVSADGVATTVAYGDDQRPVVLYVFSPTCRWCERNLNSIRALAESAGARYRFVGISSGAGADGLVASYGFPVVLTKKLGPFRSTPQTVVVGSDGRVMQAWIGAYVGSTKAEVEKYFTTQLPAIEPGTQGGQ